MDSVTQAVLGASVSAALLGPKMGARRAAIWGAALGTLPDLDVLYQFDNPVDAFTLHRGPTHSLIIQALAAPIVAEGIYRIHKSLHPNRWWVIISVYLVFATHALLDAVTIYGTRLGWPLFPDPVGLGSLFIVDPLYTIPLIVAVVWSLCVRQWSVRLGRLLNGALILSTAYIGWSIAAQNWAHTKALTILEQQGIEVQKSMAIAAPLTTFAWKVLAFDATKYYNVYISMAGGDVQVYQHDRGLDLVACIQDNPATQILRDFADGYVRYRNNLGNKPNMPDAGVIMSDLRMGLTPGYVFQFFIPHGPGDLSQVIQTEEPRLSSDNDMAWFSAFLRGETLVRTAEIDAAEFDQSQIPQNVCQ